MKGAIKKGILATFVLLGASAAPVIPQDMELVHSYQTTYEAQFIETPEEFKEAFNPPVFEDTNGDGLISVSVFADRKGNQIYTQIDEETYSEMGKSQGFQKNPSKAEFIAAYELLTPKVEAAIAFDAQTNPTYASATTHTFAHTTTGSDRILWVQTWRRGGGAVTGVTYNGVAMTSLGTEILAGPGSGNQYLAMWYLVAPATGANNVVVTSGSVTEHIDGAVSYTGASQTGVPDALNSLTATVQANTSASVTTVADNSWAILFLRVDAATGVSAGAGTTLRAYTANFTATFDGNSPKTPAGSYTLNATHSSASVGWWMASFAPPGAAPVRRIINIQ